MALSGIEIYKLLPKTNCKDCGFPTCLAFAMKLAQKQIELAECPHVSEESKAKLAESSAPPIRLVTLSANGRKVEAGNEVVLFRHEKTFYHKPGLFVRFRDDEPLDEIKSRATAAAQYTVNYVGRELELDGFAVEATSGDETTFTSAVSAVQEAVDHPLILMSHDPQLIAAAMPLAGERPLIHAATADNWEEMTGLAQEHDAALVVAGDGLESLAELVQKVADSGLKDIVLDVRSRELGTWLARSTQIRRLALKKNFRPLGYPLIAVPGDAGNAARESVAAAQAIAKYAGFIVLDHAAPEHLYPLLVLRENIYTDPQKPIQVQPGLYEINDPSPEDPLLVTTNFSITYFSVANEVEAAGLPAWLLVADAEGMSVLTAWAAGNFDAERIARDVKRFNVADRITHRQIVIPGHVAVISGELEEELPGWDVRVGPREGVDLPAYLKQVPA